MDKKSDRTIYEQSLYHINDPTISHFRTNENNEVEEIQSNLDHMTNVANIATNLTEIPELKITAWCVGMMHDLGKLSPPFVKYITDTMNGKPVVRGSVDHSSAGGYFIAKMCKSMNASRFMQYSIYAHHGLTDIITSDYTDIFSKRLQKEESRVNVEKYFYELFPVKVIQDKIKEAEHEFSIQENKIKTFHLSARKSKSDYGAAKFYFGMYERVLLSLLIDADCMDTYHFMENIQFDMTSIEKRREEREKIWSTSLKKFDIYLMDRKKIESPLNALRNDISEICKNVAYMSKNLIRLLVPTGGGKTLSSLHLALEKVKADGKSRIIYVAPYCTLLDQNAEVIREAIGNKDYVLEHHSNVLFEEGNEDEKEKYDILTSNWEETPIVATTAVQFLNTLFDGSKRSIRRMHALCNSVIIIDEVQAMPIHVTKLFNLAINFLTEFARTTIILCSATQPPFEKITGGEMVLPTEIIPKEIVDNPVFNRIKYEDKTNITRGGMCQTEFGKFIRETAIKEEQLLVVVNTKKCAKNMYLELEQYQELKELGFQLFHISNNMCLVHRRQKITELTEALKKNKKVICISTTVIEAGVDISFKCGIRTISGLDHIIQTAGRVNRNGDAGEGKLYIVELEKGLEDTSRIEGIDDQKTAMRDFLYEFETNNDKFQNRIDSQESIDYYYQMYYESQKNKMEYPISIGSYTDSLVKLFSGKSKLEKESKNQQGSQYLTHLFKTAGDKFNVIPEDDRINIVVGYDKNAWNNIDIAINEYARPSDRKRAIKHLQAYTVGISKQMKEELNNAITPYLNGELLVLSKDYYSKEYGVTELSTTMENLQM